MENTEKVVYLDNAATTACAPEALAVMVEALNGACGNPSMAKADKNSTSDLTLLNTPCTAGPMLLPKAKVDKSTATAPAA